MGVAGQLKSAITGARRTIGIKGSDGSIVNLDVTTDFSQDYQATVPTYPVERAPGENEKAANITDHVAMKETTMSLSCVLSNSFNLDNIVSSNISLFDSPTLGSNVVESAQEKLQQLITWMRKGEVLSVLGYGTGARNSFMGGANDFIDLGPLNMWFKENASEEPFYLGIDREEVKSVVIKNIKVKRTPDLGNNVGVDLTLQRIYIATAKKGSVKSTPVAQTKQVDTKNGEPANEKTKSLAKSG